MKNNLFLPAVAYNRRMDITSPKPARKTACTEACILEFSMHMGALVDGPEAKSGKLLITVLIHYSSLVHPTSHCNVCT